MKAANSAATGRAEKFTMTTATEKAAATRELIDQLVAEARKADTDRRLEARLPLFRSVSIHIDGHCHSAFSREISPSSIGLLHFMELPLGEVEISIRCDSKRILRFRTRIQRCEPCGAGWYTSGGELVGVAATGTQARVVNSPD
jgi:hypothetical protein